ncbi:MAG: hypothetical protein ACRDD2_10440 [Sarcina sp.]
MKFFKVSNFLFKIFVRSWFLILGIILSIYFLTLTYSSYVLNFDLGFINYVKSQEFALLTSVVTCSASIIFGLKFQNESIDYLIRNPFNYFLAALIAGIKLGLCLCLVPLSYFITYLATHRGLPISYVTNGLFEFVFTFFLCIVCTNIMTIIICFLFKNNIIRLFISAITIFITSSAMDISFNTKFKMVIGNIFNVHEDFDYSRYSNFFGFNHDIRFILDKLIVVAIVVIILLIIAIKFYRKSKYLKVIKASILSLVALVVISFGVLYNSFTFMNQNEIFSYDKEIEEDFIIEEYKMNLDFAYNLKNEAIIKIKNNSENKVNKISLLLDNVFKIDSINLEGENLNFTHEGNKINIALNKALEKDSKIDLQINYKGRVNHIDAIGNQYVIANGDKVFLPTESLIWYPSTNQELPMNFDIKLDSKVDIKSNLVVEENSLKGKSKDIFLMSGFSKTVDIEGYEVTYPLESESELKYSFESLEKSIIDLNLSESEKEEIKNKKRIIFAPINYGATEIIKILDGIIIS